MRKRQSLEKAHTVDELIPEALRLGVSAAGGIPVTAISVEEHLAELCREPRCPGYGQSVNCPPHVMTPAEFRESLQQYEQALVFKIDVPTEILLGDERREVARVIHETAAELERLAVDLGYTHSRGLAAGSCKPLFCGSYETCRALEEGGDCRFPDRARPSMSGLGINVFKLSEVLGWQIEKITRDSDPGEVPMGLLAGMVLLGGCQPSAG